MTSASTNGSKFVAICICLELRCVVRSSVVADSRGSDGEEFVIFSHFDLLQSS